MHGVGDEGIPFRQLTEVIGRHLDVPVVSIDAEDAGARFGPLAHLVVLDNPTSNALTREALAWEPTHVGLIEDLEEGHYFAGVTARSRAPGGKRG